MRKRNRVIIGVVATVFLAAGIAFGLQQWPEVASYWFYRSIGKRAVRGQIMLNPSITHQTITGWETVSGMGNNPISVWTPQLLAAMPFVLDRAVSDLGLNRLRLEIPCNAENPVDIWNTGGLPFSGQVINDNADPNVINPAGFHFSYVDFIVEHILLPMKARVEANGEHLYVNALYDCFRSPADYAHVDPREYAEFVLAAVQHLQSRYGIVPDSWEMVLEPDNDGIPGWHSGTTIGKALVATAERLSANGFHPRFIAPSTLATDHAIEYFSELNAVPGATALLAGGELSYHRYSEATQANVQTIAGLGKMYGINTSMLEFFTADYNDLHQDLEFGNVSAWERFSLFNVPPPEPLGYIFANPQGDTFTQATENWVRAYFGLNPAGYIFTNPANPAKTTAIQSASRWLRQYFKFIRAGAVRIDATSGSSGVHPLAFINSNGKYVVVVKTDAGETFNISSLPAGSYGIEYTINGRYNVDLQDYTVSDGTLVTGIPAKGIITIYKR